MKSNTKRVFSEGRGQLEVWLPSFRTHVCENHLIEHSASRDPTAKFRASSHHHYTVTTSSTSRRILLVLRGTKRQSQRGRSRTTHQTGRPVWSRAKLQTSAVYLAIFRLFFWVREPERNTGGLGLSVGVTETKRMSTIPHGAGFSCAMHLPPVCRNLTPPTKFRCETHAESLKRRLQNSRIRTKILHALVYNSSSSCLKKSVSNLTRKEADFTSTDCCRINRHRPRNSQTTAFGAPPVRIGYATVAPEYIHEPSSSTTSPHKFLVTIS